MEIVVEDTASLTSFNSSPRSILGWKDDWGTSESSGLESTNKSSAELASDIPDGPKTPPLQLERRLFRSPPPVNPNQRLDGSLPLPNTELHRDTEGSKAPVAELWSNSPPTPTLRAFQPGPDEHGRLGQAFELLSREDRQADESPTAPSPRECSTRCLSALDDENSVGTAGEDTWSVDSSSSTAAARAKKAPQSGRMKYMASLSDELNSIKSAIKRALHLRKKVQHYGTLEVSQLQEEKANAEEASVQKSVEVNRSLDQQMSTLREELQKLKVDRELEILAMNNEIQELKMENNTLMKAARDEKKKREELQSEVDSVLSVILEEKMKLEIEREAHDAALRNERKKLLAMKKARDDAVKALQDGTKKLEVERDAMLTAMRDLTSRLDFERDAKLKSMRRTSMDMASMISSFRSGGSRKTSISISDDAPLSNPISRRNSRQF